MRKFCGNCGAEVDENANVCGFCGTPCVKEEISEKRRKPKFSKKVIAICVSAFVVIVGVVITILCVNSRQTIDEVVKAVVDAEFGCTSMSVMKDYAKVLPDNYLDYLVEEGDGWLWDNEKDWIKYQYEEYSDDTDYYLSKYGYGYNYMYRITDEYQYVGEDYIDCVLECAEYGIFPKEAKDITINVRASGNGNVDNYTITITVIKIGNSWYTINV